MVLSVALIKGLERTPEASVLTQPATLHRNAGDMGLVLGREGPPEKRAWQPTPGPGGLCTVRVAKSFWTHLSD